MVTLTNVKQIRGGVSRVKYEAEFEALGTHSQLNLQEEMAVPWSELTSIIPLLLEQVQNVCSQMSCIRPCHSATGVAQALLRSWAAERDEIQLKEILTREFLPATSKSDVVGDDPDQVSMHIFSLIESLCHCDGRVLKEGIDVAAELQLALLHVMRTMNISHSLSLWRAACSGSFPTTRWIQRTHWNMLVFSNATAVHWIGIGTQYCNRTSCS